MPTVGAFARVETDDTDATHRRLSALDGVTIFELGVVGKIGLLIEAPDLDAAHHTLTEVVKPTDGVLAVWPVYVDIEDISTEGDAINMDVIESLRRSPDAADAT